MRNTRVLANLAIAGFMAVLLLGCASNRTYEVSYPTWGETLQLNHDGSFNYSSESDVLDSGCFARGKWYEERSGGRSAGISYILLTIEQADEKSLDSCQRLKRMTKWYATRGGLMPVAGEFLPRASKE